MQTKNGILCYDGPPVWILTPPAVAAIRKLPECEANTHKVWMDMADGQRVFTTVFGGTLCDLPEPYLPRDIRRIGRAR